MHKIRFPLGLRPRPRWGSLQRYPDSLAEYKGPTFKGKREEGSGGGGERRGREGKRKRREVR